jgi:hypothetical protein
MKNTKLHSSLFVITSFLVGITPKTSKAGSVQYAHDTEKNDSVYTIIYEPSYLNCYPVFSQEFVNTMQKMCEEKKLSNINLENTQNFNYTISSYERCVKYVLSDGSGFTRKNGSRTWRNMNPGAIRYGDFSRQYGACGKAGGFAVFPTEEQGMEALKGLLKSDRYCNLTIAAAIYKWAPPSDHNNTKAYQRHLSKMTGLNLSTKLRQLTPAQLDKVANAIKIIEGWKEGNEEFFDKSPKIIGMTQPNLNNIVNYQNTRQYNA